MNSLDATATEAELERYRARCQTLETRTYDLQLDLCRLQHLSQSTQRLLDSRDQQLAQLHSSTADLQRQLEERLAEIQLEVQQKQGEVAALRDALAGVQADRATLTQALAAAERHVLSLRSSLSWRVTAPARWVLGLLRGF